MPNRAGVLICTLAMTALAILGLWRAFAAEPPTSHTITIRAMKFEPAVVHVHHGELVVFKNDDFLPHTATEKPDRVFDSGIIKPGDSWILRSSSSASVHYGCTYHPTMEGEIIVDQ